MEVNIHEAKTQLSRLLRRVAEGEEITISRAGVPVAKLVAVPRANRLRPLGAMEGQIYIADDFDAPLPDDLLALFYGEELRHKKPARVKSEKPAKKRARR
ncbi:MAG: type II toxin-antitoxin system Phd/YefM family antitoxin [Terriglobales bacterium]|jgi:prevent-host-death family protein